MRFSRLFLPLLFVFALLSAQQGSTAHAFSHLFAEQGQDKQAPHSPTCEKCASYVQLGSALITAPHEFTPLDFADAKLARSFQSAHSQHALAASARAPPVPLPIA